MKLCACYNTWNDLELLKHSIANIRPLVDLVIVIFSRKSNTGETYDGPDGSSGDGFPVSNVPIYFRQYEPMPNLNQRDNEMYKRNAGLKEALNFGCTHFISLDSDEFYDPIEFTKAKLRFNVEPNLKGLVCPLEVFFKSPRLSAGRDVTLVPFIHVLTPTIRHEFNRNYPFAWSGKQICIDPTRSLNITRGIEYTEDVVMKHYSWVRRDVATKIRNSTARTNIERSTILDDLKIAAPGVWCEFYKTHLKEVPNTFNLPEF